ncbi:MAG: thioredoxin family protein [Pseudomonadota bacterium]
MIDRRTFSKSLAMTTALTTLSPVTAWAAGGGDEPAVDDDGIYTQDWFNHSSFLVLSEDIEEAAAEGKRMAILFEQRGCPYCRELHRVNLAKPEIRDYIKSNFTVLQLNIWGSKAVTDFDGEELEERALAKKWRVHYTPTIVFLNSKPGETVAKTEVVRMPGYFKPFHFVTMFEYVKEEAYKDQQFQRFLQARFEELEKQGKKPEIW